jgi:transcriptional regulator GlxA family with amidase domain
MGCAPQEFLIRQRLASAAELLRSTNFPIKTIADQCGYRDQLHFSQAFRKRYGLPPREWRRQNKS